MNKPLSSTLFISLTIIGGLLASCAPPGPKPAPSPTPVTGPTAAPSPTPTAGPVSPGVVYAVQMPSQVFSRGEIV
jgi:hypothetical protein